MCIRDSQVLANLLANAPTHTPAGTTVTTSLAAGEPLEDARQRLGRDAGAVVEDGENHLPGRARVQAGGDGGAGGSVRAGVGEQVGEHLVQPGGVADHGDLLVG